MVIQINVLASHYSDKSHQFKLQHFLRFDDGNKVYEGGGGRGYTDFGSIWSLFINIPVLSRNKQTIRSNALVNPLMRISNCSSGNGLKSSGSIGDNHVRNTSTIKDDPLPSPPGKNYVFLLCSCHVFRYFIVKPENCQWVAGIGVAKSTAKVSIKCGKKSDWIHSINDAICSETSFTVK